jgi:3-phenylpropionate/cinnamic acid dioxygenase small subunit
MTELATQRVTVNDVEQFLYAEARMLDERDFEGWLECYAPDAEFWMPAWDDDDTLTTDPHRQISLIWYGNRGGLEDRVFRIRTDRSSKRATRSRCGSTGSRSTTATRRSTPTSGHPGTPWTSPGRSR